MKRALASFLLVALTGCTAAVSDINGFRPFSDACDPRGSAELGDDLSLQFVSTNAHINQDMFFAIEVGEMQSIEAIMVLSTLDSPNMLFDVPEILPEGPSTLAFWADTANFLMFDPIDGTMAPDHQWTRPICPNGQMTFTHTTPFQSIVNAVSTGAVWRFSIPTEIQRPEVFDNFRIAAWAVRVNDSGRQTRTYYRWQPYVSIAPGMPIPPQRPPPAFFQVGGNALGERRGAFDSGELYEINFVIDVDDDGELGSRGDYVCQWINQAMPAGGDPLNWFYVPDLSVCDAPRLPNDPSTFFDPVTYVP